MTEPPGSLSNLLRPLLELVGFLLGSFAAPSPDGCPVPFVKVRAIRGPEIPGVA